MIDSIGLLLLLLAFALAAAGPRPGPSEQPGDAAKPGPKLSPGSRREAMPLRSGPPPEARVEAPPARATKGPSGPSLRA
jgi:hypothetical protein